MAGFWEQNNERLCSMKFCELLELLNMYKLAKTGSDTWRGAIFIFGLVPAVYRDFTGIFPIRN